MSVCLSPLPPWFVPPLPQLKASPALLPFADSTAAVLMMFLPGQEEGNAFARVILGDVAPSARLPLSIPHANNEIGLTPQQYPGVDLRSEYRKNL